MNLSPKWVEVFRENDLDAIHWSAVGNPRAPDRVIMEWAKNNQYIVFTNDLDFGAILAATKAASPSVIQVRTQDVLPQNLGNTILDLLRQFESLLESGVLIVVDENRSRVRILPIN